MAIQAEGFAFDENASLDDNLSAFGDYIDQMDAELGVEMRGATFRRFEGKCKADEVWDRLFEICAAPPAEVKNTSEVEVAAAPRQRGHRPTIGRAPAACDRLVT